MPWPCTHAAKQKRALKKKQEAEDLEKMLAEIDGKPADYLEIVGTGRNERDAYEMVLEAGIWSKAHVGKGHPPFIIMKGPDGFNAPWRPLSPPEIPETPRSTSRFVAAGISALVVVGLTWFARFVARRRCRKRA